jgi:hypothetical protein
MGTRVLSKECFCRIANFRTRIIYDLFQSNQVGTEWRMLQMKSPFHLLNLYVLMKDSVPSWFLLGSYLVPSPPWLLLK